MRFDNLAADREPQAGPGDPAAVRVVDSIELLEQPRDRSGRYTQSLVADRDLHLTVHAPRANPDRAAAWRVLARVGEQIGQHLQQAARVGPDRREWLGKVEPDRSQGVLGA